MKSVVLFLSRLLMVATFPLFANADANSNPAIARWVTIGFDAYPSFGGAARQTYYYGSPGETITVCFDYVIFPGIIRQADLAQAAGSAPRVIPIMGTSIRVGNPVCQQYTIPLTAKPGEIRYVPADGDFIRFADPLGKIGSIWSGPIATARVVVVAPGAPHVPPQSGSSAGSPAGVTGGELFPSGQVLRTDADDDGLFDQYELRYFGDLTQGADEDWDDDGITNLQELNLGMDPTVADTLKAPRFSEPDGFISGYQVRVVVANPNPIGVLRYTTNGSIPTLSSPVCTEQTSILMPDVGAGLLGLQASATTLRVGLFVNGQLLREKSMEYKRGPLNGAELGVSEDVLPAKRRIYKLRGKIKRVGAALQSIPLTPPVYCYELPLNMSPAAFASFQDGTEYYDTQGVQDEGEGWLCIPSQVIPLNPTTLLVVSGTLIQSGPGVYAEGTKARIIRSGQHSDTDNLSDAMELFITKTRPDKTDTDGDTLSDYYEYARKDQLDPNNPSDAQNYLYPPKPSTPSAAKRLDSDGDGLSDEDEETYKTLLDNPDSDNDGISDVFEVSIYSNPLPGQNPGDRGGARQEVISPDFIASMWAQWRDRDSDFIPDDYEKKFPGWLNVANSNDGNDADKDELSDRKEWSLGTNPAKIDTDADGMPDKWEVDNLLEPRSDTDAEIDLDVDGLINRLEWQFNANPHKKDGDIATENKIVTHPVTGLANTGDAFDDLLEVHNGLDPLAYDTTLPSLTRSGLTSWLQSTDSGLDSDEDGLSDLAESIRGSDRVAPDTDGDTMPDGYEVRHGLNPLLADSSKDSDGDGLTNLQELAAGLSPSDFDSDNDGLGDGWETNLGLNPASNLLGLVAWWRLDTLYDRTILDSASGLHDGRLRGKASIGGTGYNALRADRAPELALLPPGASPPIGSQPDGYTRSDDKALQFDGKDSYATIPDHSNLRLANSFTISLWVRPALGATRVSQRLLSKRASYALDLVRYSTSSHRPKLGLFIGEEYYEFYGTGNVVLGVWNHLVITRNAETGVLLLYLNGSLDSTHAEVELAEPIASSPWPLILGSQRVLPDSLTPDSNTRLDDLRLYDRVVSAEDIAELANPRDRALEANMDRDGDGLGEVGEFTEGSDPLNPHSDNDGITDGDEVNMAHGYKTSPIRSDTDGDTLSDSDEIFNYATDPTKQDTDSDDVHDRAEVLIYRTSSVRTNNYHNSQDRATAPLADKDRWVYDGWDTDSDGLPDYWEILHHFNPRDPADRTADPDGDEIVNYWEYRLQKFPRYPDLFDLSIDTDGDGLADWLEIHVYGSDPNNQQTLTGVGDLTSALNGTLPGTSGPYSYTTTSTPPPTLPPPPPPPATPAPPPPAPLPPPPAPPQPPTPPTPLPPPPPQPPPAPQQLWSPATLALPITPKPDHGKIAYTANTPPPLVIPGQVVALTYQTGDGVYIAEEAFASSPQLISAFDRLFIKDPSGVVAPESLSLRRVIKPDVIPSEHLGRPAEAAYEYGAEYDVTAFAAKLTPDSQGYIRFQLVAEVDPVFEREPPPDEDGENNNNNNNNNGGNPGGSDEGEAAWTNWWALSGWGYLDRWSPNGNTSPVLPGATTNSTPTYAATKLTAYVENRLDLDVSHASAEDTWLSELDEDAHGAIITRATLDENQQLIAPTKKSKLRIGKGPAETVRQVVSWDSAKIRLLENGQLLANNPHEFEGNDVHELEMYAITDGSSSEVVLKGFDSQNHAIPGDSVKLVNYIINFKWRSIIEEKRQIIENIHPLTSALMPGGGFKWYPDALSSAELDYCDKIAIEVLVGGAVAGDQCYMEIFDVDDPRSSTIDGDGNDDIEYQSGQDNLAGYVEDFRFSSTQNKVAIATIGPDGIARINGLLPVITVSKSPGDNCRIAVCMLGPVENYKLQVENNSDPLYVTPDCAQLDSIEIYLSPMLTIWRFLRYEIDVMAAPSFEQNTLRGRVHNIKHNGSTLWEADVLPGIVENDTDATYAPGGDEMNGGFVKFDFGGGQILRAEIFDYEDNWYPLPDKLQFIAPANTVLASTHANIVMADDDVSGAVFAAEIMASHPVPSPDMSYLANCLADACIEIQGNSEWNSSDQDFARYMTYEPIHADAGLVVDGGYSLMGKKESIQGSPSFKKISIVGMYQLSPYEDSDGLGQPTIGYTPFRSTFSENKRLAYFWEDARESSRDCGYYIAHEAGHALGLRGHTKDGSIMEATPGSGIDALRYSPGTILTIRKNF